MTMPHSMTTGHVMIDAQFVKELLPDIANNKILFQGPEHSESHCSPSTSWKNAEEPEGKLPPTILTITISDPSDNPKLKKLLPNTFPLGRTIIDGNEAQRYLKQLFKSIIQEE